MKSFKLIVCGLIVLMMASFRVDAKRVSVLRELNETDWKDMLKGDWMVEFFSPSCAACGVMLGQWERFAKTAHEQGVHIARIDVNKSPSLSGRFFVNSLPTIYHVKDGDFRVYNGARDNEALIKYFKQSQWIDTEPISVWRRPSACHMSVLSVFFDVSRLLKTGFQTLREVYGLPGWCSGVLIATSSILLGGIIGLVLIIILDVVFPTRPQRQAALAESLMQIEDDILENMDENIKDQDDGASSVRYRPKSRARVLNEHQLDNENSQDASSAANDFAKSTSTNHDISNVMHPRDFPPNMGKKIIHTTKTY